VGANYRGKRGREKKLGKRPKEWAKTVSKQLRDAKGGLVGEKSTRQGRTEKVPQENLLTVGERKTLVPRVQLRIRLGYGGAAGRRGGGKEKKKQRAVNFRVEGRLPAMGVKEGGMGKRGAKSRERQTMERGQRKGGKKEKENQKMLNVAGPPRKKNVGRGVAQVKAKKAIERFGKTS